jgi:hypothetical protein
MKSIREASEGRATIVFRDMSLFSGKKLADSV